MRKLYTRILLTFTFIFLAGDALSQELVTDAVKKQQLTDLSGTLNTRYQASHKRAFDLAKQRGWPTYKLDKKGKLLSLQGVDDLGAPIYLKTLDNVIAAATTHTNTVQTGGSLGLNLSGSSTYMANKLAIWDGSSVYTAHQEFAGKTISIKDGSTATLIDHSTHVAGTMIAKGVYAPAKGMSFGAATLQSYDFNNDLAEMASAASGLLISNHSYGFVNGWDYNDAQSRWEWYGLPGDTVDYNFGFYATTSQTLDQIAVSAPQYLMVFAAGNSRGETGPAIGTVYYGYASRTDFTIVNKGLRPATISSNAAYDDLDAHAVAKNVLTVGAVNPLPYGPASGSAVQNAYFSSWGPTDDGRVKPDISGDGVNVLSTGSTAPNAYLVLSGTSMATPNVSGSLYLLQEYYAQKNSSAFMRAATLKGLVCHTALDAGNPGPDYVYGWGLLDMTKAAQAITDNGTKSLIAEKTLAQGQTQTYNVVASGNGPLMATISWTDPAGTPTIGTTINDRTPKLVNDLDIRISDGTTTFKPWVLDPNNPSANATTGDNIRDNVEQVYIGGTVPGKSYTITVTHKGTLVNASQNYSLIVTGIGGAAYCASAPASNADSRIDNVTLSNINFSQPAGCTTYSNYTGLTATLEQGKTYPLSVSLGTCGNNFNKIVKVYIDYNGNGVFDTNELVAASGVYATNGVFTTNITVPTTVTPGNLSLMRIVLSETTDPTTISPCGSYAKGETQDYTVQFVKPANDVGVIAINTPAATGTCPSATSPVSVKLQNFGSAVQSNIPVTVTITSGAGVVSTFNETYTGTLNPLDQADFVLAGTFNALASVSYTVSATTTLATDENNTNNQVTATAVINQSPTVTNASAAYCTDANMYSLTGTGDGTVFWYKNIGDALPFTYGASTTTTVAPVNNTYYAGLNDFTGTVGPANKEVFSAGGYNQFTPLVYVKTQVPVVIQSARLYIGNPGTLTFTVNNSSGLTVASTTLNVTATRTTAGAGAQNDDPNDVGKVYNLNLTLPVADTYTINITYPDNATIYRNNGGVTGYPFAIGNIFSISGNNATSGAANDTTTYKGFYYYFYNMQVKSTGCVSVVRIPVSVVKPTITLNGTVLTSNFTANNQWYLNDSLIVGATNQNYMPLVSGIYRVDVTTATGCISKSDNFSFVLPLKGSGDGADISLAVFPVPTSNQLNIAFNATKNEQFTIAMKNALGQNVYSDVRQITAGPYNTILNVSNIADGNYFLQLKIGDTVYIRKITIIR